MNYDPDVFGMFKTIGSQTVAEFALVLVGAGILTFMVRKMLPWIADRLHGRRHFVVLALVPILRLLIWLVALAMLVPLIIEPTLQNMIAVLGAFGVAIGFAMKDYASSLIAGVVSVMELNYRPGDWIEMNGVYGEVVHVGLRVVRIVTPDDTMVSIPHLKLWTESVHNANNGGPSLQCVTNFFLHPDHDAKHVRQLLLDVALSSPFLQIEKTMAVIVQEKPWGTHYILRAYPVDPRQQFRFISDLTARGKEALLKAGVKSCAIPTAMNMS